MALAGAGIQRDRSGDFGCGSIFDSGYVDRRGSRGSGGGRRRDASVSQKEDGVLSDLRRSSGQPRFEHHSGWKHRVFRDFRSDHAADYLAADQKYLV